MDEKANPQTHRLSNDVPSTSSEVTLQNIDPSVERSLLRRVDWHLIPILALLFLSSFIDRINIGNARIQGLEADLHMAGQDYNIALFVFFIPYILLEVPSNLLLKKIKPSVWLSSIIFGWGVITVCQGVTQSFAGLVICRVLLGVFEAGFVPGCIYLLSMYYKRHELQLRVNLFFSAGIIAGAFSGLLAYAIANMSGVAGYSGWRWIFILEGIFTIIIASFSYFIVPDWPETAKFLRPKERALLLSRLAADTADAKMDRWDKKTANRIFRDPKIYLGYARIFHPTDLVADFRSVFMYMGITTTGYGGSFFTPTILKQLGWTSIKAQVMSIPIYIVATILTLVTAVLTDKFKHRFTFIIIGCVIATVGYIILLCMRSVPVGARYFALYAVTCGGYIAQPVCLVWLSNNVSGHYKRGVSSAMQIGLGNLGGIIASNIYLPDELPYYPVGFGVSLALVWMCAISAVLMLVYLMRENKRRVQGKRDELLNLPREELDNMGDDHPGFRFTY